MQRRECDAAAGTWSRWSECMGDEDCSGGGGPMECDGPLSEACGGCGMRTRRCDTATGELSEWSECSSEGECEPGAMQTCGNGGTQRCGDDCTWESACSMQACNAPLREACGACGTRLRACDGNTGMPTAWGPCLGQGPCTPGTMQPCGADKTQFCDGSCQWGECRCAPGLTDCGGGCQSVRSDRNNCGACGRRCVNREICSANSCSCPLTNPGPNCTAM